jgi:integron integrase
MDGNEGGRPDDAAEEKAVHVRLRGSRLELRFGRFVQADVDAVKSIPGRRWQPDRRIWELPHTQETMSALTRSFGARLVLLDAQGGGRAPAPPNRPAVPLPQPARPESFQRAAEALLDAMRRAIRTRGYSRKTEKAYLAWARRFLRFHADRVAAPEKLDASHAREFLEHLAMNCRLAARSRNQSASALGFMFRDVLGRDEMAGVPRAASPKRVPLVLSHREVLRVLRELVGKQFLIAVLLYSAGLRLEACLRLRVKDIDFELRQILVRDGKGRKDRYVPLAERATELLRAQFRRVADLHAKDRARGHGWAALPGALHRKDPLAGYEAGWQFVFPASTINTDPATGRTGRWPLHATAVQRQVKRAVRRSGITKRATCHTFRHSFATEALRGGCDIRTLQHVMGHKDIRTTMIYLHVIEQTGHFIRSPLDRPDDPEEYDVDPVGKPLGEIDIHWDLAAKQWGRAGKPRKPREP